MKRKPKVATKPAAKAKPGTSAPPTKQGKTEPLRDSAGKPSSKTAPTPAVPAKPKRPTQPAPVSATQPATRQGTSSTATAQRKGQKSAAAESGLKTAGKPERSKVTGPVAVVPAGKRPPTAVPAADRSVGPGRRYALGPTPVSAQSELLGEPGELPEAYGSKRLFLAARDPHWLYAHWDFTAAQLGELNALSAQGRPVLRVHIGSLAGPPCCEVHVHPGSRNWFVHVGQGGTKYVAELGYYRQGDRVWTSVCQSEATLTPPDITAEDSDAEFATIPIDVPFEALSVLIQTVAKENVPLAEAIMQLRAAGYEGLPGVEEWPTLDWTPQRENALAHAVSDTLTLDGIRRAWVGSLEITELLRRGLLRQRGSAEFVSSAGLGVPSQPVTPAPSSVSSPYGVAPSRKGFWFNVNAELIVYGATEPDATVTLGGRPIRLRPDGTFSFRFALPDGEYELPAVAVSVDGSDQRQAALEFSRSTHYEGEVGTHPQDPNLKKPEAAAVG